MELKIRKVYTKSLTASSSRLLSTPVRAVYHALRPLDVIDLLSNLLVEALNGTLRAAKRQKKVKALYSLRVVPSRHG
jgi:histidine ammonia-lyase